MIERFVHRRDKESQMKHSICIQDGPMCEWLCLHVNVSTLITKQLVVEHLYFN
jgi:hypothetical protein